MQHNARIQKTLEAFGHDALLSCLETSDGYDGVRGVDFYGPRFPAVYRSAIRNFSSFHGRLPDAGRLPLAADHLFFSKFFRIFPTNPNAASKLNAVRFLDKERFGEKVYVPRRFFISTTPSLPEDLSSVSGWLLKLDLGNAAQFKVPTGLGSTQQRVIRHRVEKWFAAAPYGAQWGEWWYSASPQRVFFEEDLTDRMTGDEYQFFMKRGRCVMFKKKRIFKATAQRREKTVVAFYDCAGNHIPGTQSNFDVPDDLSISSHTDVMLETALQIAAYFDHIRVDFIVLHDEPALGELTCCTMNARIRYSNTALEAVARDAVRLDLSGI